MMRLTLSHKDTKKAGAVKMRLMVICEIVIQNTTLWHPTYNYQRITNFLFSNVLMGTFTVSLT